MKLPLVPEGIKFIIPVAVAALGLLAYGLKSDRVGMWIAGGVLMVLSVLLVNFFRDPERVTARPFAVGEVVCPADGVVVACGESQEPLYLKGKAFHIAIFMNVFDCHVQRMPLEGKVLRKAYHPGKFMAAFAEKASLDNEQSHLVIELRGGKRRKMVLKQIAGLLARRVVTDAEEGQTLLRGQRFGRILLGSRVDVFLPSGFRPSIRTGDRVWAGETLLGEIP